MYSVFLQNTTVTPPGIGAQQLIAAALEDVGADYVGPGGEYRLVDGEVITYLDDAYHDAGWFEFEKATEAVAGCAFRLAQRLGALILFEPEGRQGWRTSDNPGDPLSGLTRGDLGVVSTPAELRELMFTHASSSADEIEPAKEPKSLGSRSLGDMFFGKSV